MVIMLLFEMPPEILVSKRLFALVAPEVLSGGGRIRGTGRGREGGVCRSVLVVALSLAGMHQHLVQVQEVFVVKVPPAKLALDLVLLKVI